MTDTTNPEMTGDAPSLEELSGEGVAPQEAQEATQPEPEAPEPPEAKPEKEQPFWYRKEIEKERKEKAALARENEELRQQRNPADLPDPRQDPASYFETQRVIDRLERSEDRFVDKHGDQVLDEVRDWMLAMPENQRISFEAFCQNQRHPWHTAHEHYRRAKMAAEIGDDPAEWRKSQERQIREEVEKELRAQYEQSTPVMAPQPRIPAPASSARSAPAKGAYAGPAPLSEIGKNRF